MADDLHNKLLDMTISQRRESAHDVIRMVCCMLEWGYEISYIASITGTTTRFVKEFRYNFGFHDVHRRAVAEHKQRIRGQTGNPSGTFASRKVIHSKGGDDVT